LAKSSGGREKDSSIKGVNKKPWKRTTVEQKVGDEVTEKQQGTFGVISMVTTRY
jgi:hypothetical protein